MTAILALFTTIIILLFGMLCVKSPEKAIEMQRRFYAKINWKIKPISVKKELNNTRLMGKFMVTMAAITLLLIVVKIAIGLQG